MRRHESSGLESPLMPEWSRKAALCAVFLLLLSFAYGPLVSAGFVGEDHRVLVGVSGLDPFGWSGASRLYRAPGADEHPLAALSLVWSSRTWSEGGAWSTDVAWVLRLENLLLLALAAFGVARFLPRLLEPWTDADQARAAGLVAGALLLLHPLCVTSVARISSRGDLLALAFGACSLAAFLRGRQEREHGYVALAVGLAFLACLSSKLALYLPVALAGSEYVSARRHRPRLVRLRTASTTFLVISALVALESAGRSLFAGGIAEQVHPGSPPPLAPIGTSGHLLALCMEKLGVLMLPVNTHGIGPTGYVLAALAVLIALHPGFVAARAAPRLWGRILFGWLLWVVVTELPDAGVRVQPGTLGDAQVLLAPTFAMVIGLAIGSTALSGPRRQVLPLLVAVFYSMLAHACSLPWSAASDEVRAVQAELVAASAPRPSDVRVLVLDPPELVSGIDALGPSIPYLLHPAFLPSEARAHRTRPVWVRGLSSAAFCAFVREPEFTALRERGLVLLLPRASIAREAMSSALPARLVVNIPAPRATEGRAVWRGEGRSPSTLVFESLTARSVAVLALPDARTDAVPIMRWRSRSELLSDGEAAGVWLESEQGPVATFDLGARLDWLLGGRIDAVWFLGSLDTVASAEVLTGVDTIAGNPVPRPVGKDWAFDVSGTPLPRPLVASPPEAAGGADPRWVLSLLDLGSLDHAEVTLEELEGVLWARDVVPRVERAQRVGGGPIAWTLDLVHDGQSIARARGRRAGIGRIVRDE